jgi:hypothetical protein
VSQLLTSGLLAASMLLGQTGQPSGSGPTYVPAPPFFQTQPQTTQRPILGWFNRDDRPVLGRIGGWFKRDQQDAPAGRFAPPPRGTIRETEQPPPIMTPTPTAPNDFPRRLPNPSSQAPANADPIGGSVVELETPGVTETGAAKAIEQTTVQTPAAPKMKSPILPALAAKIGRDEKFEWMTGQLEIENGNFVLYYATPETVDQYNGRIALSSPKADLSKFQRGDLVSLRGQLVQRSTAQGVVPIYRVSDANLIERVK